MRIVLSLALLSLTACQVAAPLDELGSSQSAITEGSLSADGTWPETVFLWLGGSMCTGTLVAPTVVLTARHCMEGAQNPEVYFGNDPESSGGTWLDVAGTSLHPTADIAMITLEAAAPVRHVPIHKNLTQDYVGRQVDIVGFGDTQGDGPAGIKREGITTISELRGELMTVGATGADTCFGDSGGPTFIEEDGIRYVAAVTSFGDSNDCRAGLSFNVRTDTYAEWIEAYILEASCGQADGLCINDCGEPDPDCRAVGEACVDSGECSDNLCATVKEESMCTQACTADAECPVGFECLDKIACWPESPDSGGCSTGRGTGQGGLFFLLLGVAVMATRRRRP